MPSTGRHRSNGWFTALWVGLLVSQLIATAVVYQSNHRLDRKVTAISAAGYLAVPTPDIDPGLRQIKTALGGGLFFTLSTGAALVLLSIPAVRFGRRLSQIHRRLPLILILLPAGLLVWINADGFNWIGTLFVAAVPLCVMLCCPSPGPRPSARAAGGRILAPAAALVILAGGWLTQFNDNLFVNIRDFVLLSNPVGVKINDFYYRYTLFPAEVFKSLEQKTLRAYTTSADDPIRRHDSLVGTLKAFDYLPVNAEAAADLVLRATADRLDFLQHGRIVLQTDARTLSDQPRPTLRNLSNRADRFRTFRQLTFLGILFAFPVTLFLLLYGGLLKVLDMLMPPGWAALAAAVLCLGLGTAPLWAVHNAGGGRVARSELPQLLSSANWQERTRALRAIDAEGIDIGNYPRYKALLGSKHLPERYWLARALGASRIPSTYDDLLHLLQDPHPNVVCQAFYALGRRGDPQAIAVIRAKIAALDNWYSQRYGYNALKRLGWVQSNKGAD